MVEINYNDFHKINWNSLSEKKNHHRRVVSKFLGRIYSQILLLAPGYADIELSVHFSAKDRHASKWQMLICLDTQCFLFFDVCRLYLYI